MAKGKLWKAVVFGSVILSLSSCKVSVQSTIYASSLKSRDSFMVEVLVRIENSDCPKQSIEGYRCKNGAIIAKVPVLTSKNLSMIKGERFGAYYGDGKNLILFINGVYLDGLNSKLVSNNVSIKSISVEMVNDTDRNFSFGASGVWIDGIGAIGQGVEYFDLKPKGRIVISLSDTGIYSLMRYGVEPVATFIGA